jgi:hypothetical protein
VTSRDGTLVYVAGGVLFADPHARHEYAPSSLDALL